MAEVVVLVAEVVTNIKADYKKSAFCVKKTPAMRGSSKKAMPMSGQKNSL